MSVISFIGLKGSGKDEAIKACASLNPVVVKMADPLKEMLRAMLTIQRVDKALIERYIEGDLKEQPSRHFGGASPRHAMQTLGTEWGRDLMCKDLWTNMMVDRVRDLTSKGYLVMLSDVRFQNELDFLKDFDCVTIRIERDQNRPVDLHESERNIDKLDHDFVITNNGTLAGFHEKVRDAVKGVLN
jgi:hypothetical protein